MASEMLLLKVSENQYRKTLEDLNTQMGKLNNVKERLAKCRTDLQRHYKADQAADLLRSVGEYEQRAKEAWEQVSKQREAILNYLSTQNNADTAARTSYSQELSKASQRFGA